MADVTEERELTHELDTSTKLAYERTRVAYERTLQASIRTATALITFGFSVYKFFQIDHPVPVKGTLIGPREFGSILVVLGILSLAFSTIEFHYRLRSLGKASGTRGNSITVALAAAISVLGICALVVMLYRG